MLALRSVDELDALADREGRSRDELEDALRAGLVRAVSEGENQGLIGVDDRGRTPLRGGAAAARTAPLRAPRRIVPPRLSRGRVPR